MIIPLTLIILIFFTLVGFWLLYSSKPVSYTNLIKRFVSFILFFMCAIIVYSDNWIYLLEYEIVNGVIG